MNKEITLSESEFGLDLAIDVKYDIESSGIGHFEFAGQQGFDVGADQIIIKDWSIVAIHDFHEDEIPLHYGVEYSAFIDGLAVNITDDMVQEKLAESGA